MPNSGYGFRDEHDTFLLDGFDLVFQGRLGQIHIVPNSVQWPAIGNDRFNELDITVGVATKSFSGKVCFGVFAGVIWELESDLRALCNGLRPEVAFPSHSMGTSLEPRAFCTLRRNGSTILAKCELGDPYVSFNQNSPPEELQRFHVYLSAVFEIELDSIEVAQAQIQDLYRYLESIRQSEEP